VSLAPLSAVLAGVRASGHAAGAFTCYDIVTADAVTAAAQSEGAPCVLLVSAAAFARRTGPALMSGCAALARDASIPVAVQLDHADDVALMRRALEAGATTIMADGSGLPFADNVALVREAVVLASRYGADVEAELGRVGGHEEQVTASPCAAGLRLTDPSEVRPFVLASGAHCLAICIGNVHGDGGPAPELDWDRLAAIRRAAPCPLALHGASGLGPEDLRRAVEGGVAKVNVNTELRRRWLHIAAAAAGDAAASASMLDVQQALTVGLRRTVAHRLECLRTPVGAR
jgi:ketose-bisphosphate aldolase